MNDPLFESGPQEPWTTSALAAGFTPLRQDHYETILPFYSTLRHPLADLDALMMVSWRRALNLHFLIEDGVLHMVASWSGKPVFWGPPIGVNVSLSHFFRAFELLRNIDQPNAKPEIRYLWEEHSLWSKMNGSGDFTVTRQSTEYHYDVLELSTLSSRRLKKKRYGYRVFKLQRRPEVRAYSAEVTDGCLELLQTWADQKETTIQQRDRQQFELEMLTCEAALRERLPLSGVVALVDGHIAAFSVGGAQTAECFNCMFEKTNLEMRGASAFIFVELAKSCLDSYCEINAGEDWEVQYLKNSKRLWKPSHIQASYLLHEKR